MEYLWLTCSTIKTKLVMKQAMAPSPVMNLSVAC